ncbi:macro domain-containing protein [Kineosporia sp. J2-2]|uniref:Macro domain-containing protein n=1 Tax=Kineosporia corallincola TaxID=2835133 RepID=A0ABS5TFP0_9ACTN|nr:macro domain-containing protein [Kineosporia corallincola]MBT0769910.1 macro domain-containing protein [Kineosporia corallincola]
MEIQVVRGDITACDVDVVVTAANAPLIGGGGVDGAVHRAAGPQLLQALRPLAPCPPGEAVRTPAFGLGPRVRHIVHAVGPRYGVDDPAAELLASAYRVSVRQCDEVGAGSVAFPALSTGAFGYPLFEACQVSVQALRRIETSLRLCLLVAFDERTRKFWERALAA